MNAPAATAVLDHDLDDPTVPLGAPRPSCAGVTSGVEDVDPALGAPAAADGRHVGGLSLASLAVDEAAAIDALRCRLPASAGLPADDIGCARQHRQDAEASAAARCDPVHVVGSGDSSIARPAVEVARCQDRRAEPAEGETGIRSQWLDGIRAARVTAGMLAPEMPTRSAVGVLSRLGEAMVPEHRTADVHVRLTLPTQVR